MRGFYRNSGSALAVALACALGNPAQALAQDEAASGSPASIDPAAASAGDDGQEPVIIVSGVRQSIENSIDEKRDASEIKDTITAEDIGQLANDNIAEALQRITGVQVDRSDDGEGQGVQIRGLSENNVQLNGETISGTAAERGVNFQDLPAELFSGVEILKSPTADAIEGSLGGTINLKTRAPLAGKKDFILNLNGTLKYAEVGKLKNQDASGFLIKQFRDTGIGDIGILLNVAYKETASVAEVYGGGDFEDAPAIWVRRTGADAYPSNPNFNNNNYNFFANPNISGRPNDYQYDYAVDVNGDGVTDGNDIYYIPNQFGFFERVRDDRKTSFNGTLEWQPAANLNIRFDTTLTDIREDLTGSRYSINFNVPREGPLIGGPGNSYSLLDDTDLLGPVYVMDAGRLGSATNRVGAAPSQNVVDRASQQYSLEADWQITPSLNFYVKGSTSRGHANSLVQGQLQTGIDHQGVDNTVFNAQDFYNIVDFDLSAGPIPNVNFYESPFPAPNYGVTGQVAPEDLIALDPGDINYVRQRYFQFQRNAVDTRNSDDSVRFDLTWEPQGGFFTAFKTGFRWAERSFARSSFQNSNQNFGVQALSDGTGDPARAVWIQRFPVDPASTGNPDFAAASQFLQACLTTAGRDGLLSQYDSNLPRTWGSTAGCDIQAISDAFNLIDVRAINPDTGVGYYEQTAEHFDVSERTLAGYVKADFLTGLGSVDLFGNVGLRYVKTRTTSSGFIQAAGGGFDAVSLPGEYDDWLPSANVNFALTKELILRLAYSRTLGRPGLGQISPGIDIVRTPDDPDYAGFGTAGNPGLEPVHSDNLDASLEWYYDKGSFLSAAVFQKNIDSTIFLASDPVPFQIGDEVFSIRTYDNFGGTKIRGLELGMAHAFNYLPGLLSNLGVTANYTIIDESSDLVDQEGSAISRRGLSKRTMNLSGYYDDGKFSVRLAYNKRSSFTRRENVALGFARPETLPEIEAGRDQLDLAVRWKIDRHVSLTFNAINLGDTGTVRYIKYPQLINYLAFSGRRYNLGVNVRF